LQAGQRSSGGGRLRFAAATFVAALAGLWAVDVLVNARLVQAVLAPGLSIAAPRHFAGLLLTLTEGALVVAAACLLGGWLCSRPRWTFDFERETVILLAAALTGLAVTLRILHPPRFSLSFSAIGAAIAALVIWLLARLVLRRRSQDPWSAGAILGITLPPALVAGHATNAAVLSFLRRGPVIHDVWLALLFLFLGCLGLRARRPAWRRSLPWFPVGLSLVAAVLFVGISSGYGRSTARDLLTRSGGGEEGRAQAAGSGAAGAPAPPSIALIVLDTVRADHLRHYGYGRNTMPVLERWAAAGMIAERAISPAGWTTPAHASIFSGRTVSRHGIHYVQRKRHFMSEPFPDFPWLPALLAGNGYTCLAITSNRLALPAQEMGFHHVLAPDHQSFEYTLGAAFDHVLPAAKSWSEQLTWRMPHLDARELTDVILRAIPADGPQPLFLFVNFIDAHSPYNPPPAALASLGVHPRAPFSRYEKHRDVSQAWARLPAHKAESLGELYDGELHWIDMQLERLFTGLRERLGEEAIIIVLSDHGEELGEEGRVGHEFGLAQRILHVPLFIWGGEVSPGRVEEVITVRRLFDFILAISAGRGPDLEVLLQRDEFGTIAERYPSGSNAGFFRDGSYLRTWVALTDERFKVVGPSTEGTEVYDLVASGFRDAPPLPDTTVASDLREAIDRYWATYSDLQRREPEEEGPSPEELERLRSLGYIK
jgi:hypothetical protein